MGIDIYMSWPDMSLEEQDNQITGFDTCAGHRGYLREAYHGGPYATRILMPEAFDDDADWVEIDEVTKGVRIPAETLRERLGATIATCKARYAEVYQERLEDEDEVLESFRNFVALAEQMERERGAVYIYASW